MDDIKRIKKQITFDLNQDALKKNYPKPIGSTNPEFYKAAYKDISSFMEKNGFDHTQYSVYESRGRLTAIKITALAHKMQREMPWLSDCLNNIVVTDIKRQHSLKKTIDNEKKRQQQLKPSVLSSAMVKENKRTFDRAIRVKEEEKTVKKTKVVNKYSDFGEEI